MDCTKQSEETCQEFSSKKFEQESDPNIEDVLLSEYIIDQKSTTEGFYKRSVRSTSGQYVQKHGYRAFSITRSEEDLAIFCLSLLQSEAEFPLRFFIVQIQDKKGEIQSENVKLKDIWLETQFLLSSDTSSEQQVDKQIRFQNRVFKFFVQKMIPMLKKFKQERLNWNYMTTQQYTDEKVIHEFNQSIVKVINKQFKKYSRQF